MTDKKDGACCPVTGKKGGIFCKLTGIAAWKIRCCDAWLAPLALLWARVFMANVFWKSGKNKIADMDSAAELFESEFIPQWAKNSQDVFGLDLSWTTPADPALAAQLAACAEVGLPALLLLGLATRPAAFALIGLAAVIELFVYPGTPEHYYWMTILLLLVAIGPGKISLDHFIRRKMMGG